MVNQEINIFKLWFGFTSRNLLNEATPIILANVIWDAESGIANIFRGSNELIWLINKSEEKLNKITIWVNKIDKAETGLILEICEPTLWAIFCDNIKAPNPINNDPKKYNFFSPIKTWYPLKSILSDKKGE